MEAQLDLIEKRGCRGNYFGGHKPLIKKLKNDDVPIITSYLKKFSESHSDLAVTLLGIIAEDPPVLNREIKDLIFSIFNKGDTRTRGVCLEFLFKAQEPDAIYILLEDDWRINNAESDYEKHWGSIFFCKYGTEIPFEDLLGRILPETLGYAIQCRSNRTEEVVAFGEFIHATWKSISSNKPLKFHTAERTKVERAWVEKDEGKNKNWKIYSGPQCQDSFLLNLSVKFG